ncbi:MAG TPA: cytochrome c [Steroidobacteraceae bacterium]
MSSRFRNEAWLALAVVLCACHGRPHTQIASAASSPGDGPVVTSALAPGLDHSLSTVDPRAAPYYENADAVNAGKRLFAQYNCAGCHSNGGGGMGPSLMDDEWIYGGRLEQIHQTLVEGRPNGMPAWGGKVPDEQLWQLAAYVRSMSLPQTLAAQNGATPSQTPAPVPREAAQDAGWSPPAQTTNDYTSTTEGPK